MGLFFSSQNTLFSCKICRGRGALIIFTDDSGDMEIKFPVFVQTVTILLTRYPQIEAAVKK